jgi:hypothetical protein
VTKTLKWFNYFINAGQVLELYLKWKQNPVRPTVFVGVTRKVAMEKILYAEVIQFAKMTNALRDQIIIPHALQLLRPRVS